MELTDEDVISELQAGNRLLKQERYTLREEIDLLKKALVESNAHIMTLNSKLVESPVTFPEVPVEA
jgi:hypothetical protein